ncbi:MAG: CBS domain-containing protein [Candidatus Natronoplasma sp.]
MVEDMPKFQEIENPIRPFVSKRVITVSPNTSVKEAAKKMVEFNISCLLVVDDDEIVGLMTNDDLKKRVVAEGLEPSVEVKKIMTEDIITADIGIPVRDALEIMANQNIKHLPVEEDNEIVGMLTFSDLIDIQKQKLETYISRE